MLSVLQTKSGPYPSCSVSHRTNAKRAWLVDGLVDLFELDLAVHMSVCIWVYCVVLRGSQDEVRVGGDEATTDGLAAVGEVAGDVQRSLLAELHLHDALVPT